MPWKCPKCGTNNEDSNTQCFACGTKRLNPVGYISGQPYIFVSYSHKNETAVLPFIRALQKKYNVWYDNDINKGDNWAQTIAKKIKDCTVFLFLVSNESLDKESFCLNELHFASLYHRLFFNVIVFNNSLNETDEYLEYKLLAERYQYSCLYKFNNVDDAVLDLTDGKEDNTKDGFIKTLRKENQLPQNVNGVFKKQNVLSPKGIITEEIAKLLLPDKNGNLVIPDGYDGIGENAFNFRTDLTSVIIPNSVTNIGKGAFFFCTYLTSVIVPDNVTNIEESAFWFCASLTSITFGKNSQLKSISNFMFCGCRDLTFITIPNSVTNIGDVAFRGCTGLTFIAIPNSVTSIGHEAFSECTSLKSITMPNSVTTIGSCAFKDSGLTSVIINNGVTKIGSQAFFRCTGLTSITFKGTKAQWQAILKGEDWNWDTGKYTVHCTDGDIPKRRS